MLETCLAYGCYCWLPSSRSGRFGVLMWLMLVMAIVAISRYRMPRLLPCGLSAGLLLADVVLPVWWLHSCHILDLAGKVDGSLCCVLSLDGSAPGSNCSWGLAAGGVRGCGISATSRNGCFSVSGEYATAPANAMDEESRIVLCLVAAIFLCEELWMKQKIIMKLPLDVKLLMLIVQLSLSQGSSCRGYV
ncbi:hypothetical protein Nepgr_018721 [Nepenthes gracilis]|uniref:Uncharacterized protein n=1 Tax=Nepenthes gracilis TaxID=150966 RepID=A0AAD3SS04_NEPGR|nr:hypothetical protein Nepgr_018721 [Nepenthes gracilis]